MGKSRPLKRRYVRHLLILFAILALYLVAAAPFFGFSATESAPTATEAASLDVKLQTALELGLPRLACNLSATDQHKDNVLVAGQGGLKAVEISPAKGSIVAADSKSDPDYYFHWMRDSSITAGALVSLMNHAPSGPLHDDIRAFLDDYVHFIKKVSQNRSHHGPGDPRANVDGSIDFIQWSRPQRDGPALQSLTLIHYLDSDPSAIVDGTRVLAEELIQTNLDYIATSVNEKSFDPWEETFGFHFYNRLVQLGALEAGLSQEKLRGRAGMEKVKSWTKAKNRLERLLKQHWDSKHGYFLASHGELTDWRGNFHVHPGGGLDTITVMAVVHAGLRSGEFGVLDSRVLSTADQLEDLFRGAYPINSAEPLGPAMGRYKGDDYYGGNPWYMSTLAEAELYYRMAFELRSGHGELNIDKRNQKLLSQILGRPLRLGQKPATGAESRKGLVSALVKKGDAFLSTVLKTIPPSGMLGEQFDKQTGSSASSHDLSWSYAALITAALARESVLDARPTRLNLASLRLRCAKNK